MSEMGLPVARSRAADDPARRHGGAGTERRSAAKPACTAEPAVPDASAFGPPVWLTKNHAATFRFGFGLLTIAVADSRAESDTGLLDRA